MANVVVVVVGFVVFAAVVVVAGVSVFGETNVNTSECSFPKSYLYVTAFVTSSIVRIFPSTVAFVHSEAFVTSKPVGSVERSNVLSVRAISYLLSSALNTSNAVLLLKSREVSWLPEQFKKSNAVLLLKSSEVSWLSLQFNLVNAVLLLKSSEVSWFSEQDK